MKRIIFALPFILVLLTACPGKKVEVNNDGKIVSQFVYDGMSVYYLWADQVVNKKPTATTTDPKAYFQTLLSDVDKQHGWSWITDDVDALLSDFSGTPTAFGWSLHFFTTQISGQFVAVVKYVFPNTPASNAGMVRGNIIDRIDGAVITKSNYEKLFDANAISISVSDQNYANTKTVSITPVKITTNPVLLDSVYESNGRKIGYLFYTDFIDDFNNQLFNTFTKFKAKGVTDLVLDLRYNHGGAINAASYLASLIAPQASVQNHSVFTILNYNNAINNLFDGMGEKRATLLGEYRSTGTNAEQNPLNANLNLNKVYIIATDDSYSASELITFCLKPYMDVVHIGSGTGGKFTGSWTIHGYDSKGGGVMPLYDVDKITPQQKTALKTWAMQPIVAIYKDKNETDFSVAGKLIPTVAVNTQENAPSSYKPVGDTRDYLLAKAISIITGIPVAAEVSTVPRSVYASRAKDFTSASDRLARQSVRLQLPAGAAKQKLSSYLDYRKF